MFSYTGGNSYTGDFALDLISIDLAPTPMPTTPSPTVSHPPSLPPTPRPSPSPTTAAPSPNPSSVIPAFTSSFESYVSDGDVSGDGVWATGVIQGTSPMSVISGSTPSGSYYTGPASAYSGNYYIYCETSLPNFPTHTFSLQSREFISGISSVIFFYHAYGNSIGTMELRESLDGSQWSTIWTKTGNHGQVWQGAQISTSSSAVKWYVDEGLDEGLASGSLGTLDLPDMLVGYSFITLVVARTPAM